MKTRVLFVDDEIEILDSFRTMLYQYNNEYEFFFASNGPEGLDIINENQIDIVISDMVMPGMDGLAFLIQVEKKCPKIIRIVLSGYSDYEKALMSTKVAHQYLLKPCDPDEIIKLLIRINKIKNYLIDDNVIKLVNTVESLPVLPDIYKKIDIELKKEDASIDKISNMISKDIALTAKILQIVNSAFFSIPAEIRTINNAVNFLGLNIIKSIVLGIKILDYNNFKQEDIHFIKKLWDHSFKVALGSSNLLRNEKQDRITSENAYMIGLLHDLGKIIMLSNKGYVDSILALEKQSPVEFYKIEKELFGISHSEIGAYLTGIWGLDENIVDAIAKHHAIPTIDFNYLKVTDSVFLANTFINLYDPEVEMVKKLSVNDDLKEMYYNIVKSDETKNIIS